MKNKPGRPRYNNKMRNYIRQLRTDSYTYRDIKGILEEKHDQSISLGTIHNIIKGD